LNGGQVAGIVIGVLAGVGLMIFLYSYYSKKHKNAMAAQTSKEFTTFEELDDEDDAQL
jgi:TRAP-type C4-dicarboxylate transport system permease large subunit